MIIGVLVRPPTPGKPQLIKNTENSLTVSWSQSAGKYFNESSKLLLSRQSLRSCPPTLAPLFCSYKVTIENATKQLTLFFSQLDDENIRVVATVGLNANNL